MTVRSGRIENFDVGVDLLGPRPVLQDLIVTGNRRGVRARAARLEVTGSTFVRNGVALAHDGATSVTGSTFRGNGVGVSCSDTSLAVVGSRFSNNRLGVDSLVCGTVVDSSSFVGGDVGLSVVPLGFGMDVHDNVFRDAGVGVRVRNAMGSSMPRVIAGNEFTDNGASGLVIDNHPDWPGVQVTGNLFRGNGFAPGANVDTAGNPLVSGVWSDDGTTFTANQAIGNAGHGIEAYGATDGGGNSAWGNGLEPQCVGVVCTGP